MDRDRLIELRTAFYAKGRLGVSKDDLGWLLEAALNCCNENESFRRIIENEQVDEDTDVHRKLAAIRAILGPTPGPVG